MTSPAARFAVCEQVLRQGSLAEDVAAAKAAGVAAIGVDADAVDAIGIDEACRILDGEGIGVSSYIALESILDDHGEATPLDETARRIEVAGRMGAPGALVVTGPLGDLAPAEAEAVCREWLTDAGTLAEGLGVRVMLEPLHPIMRQWSFVHTFADALALVGGIPGAGVVFDLGHLWWEHGLDELVRDNIADIVTVQVTNIDAGALDELRYERAPLGSGDVPVASLVSLLEACGYEGWYEYEVIVRTPRDRRVDMLKTERAWFANEVGDEP